MKYFNHIPSHIVISVAQLIAKDKQKFDRSEIYVNNLVDLFYSNGDGRPWFYDRGHFIVLGQIENETGIADFIHECGGTPTKQKVTDVLFQLSRLAKPVPEISTGMNLANGFLEVDAKRVDLLAHSEVHGQRYVLPFKYNPAAQCPIWLGFLARVLPCANILKYLQSLFGYILLGNARPHAECFSVWLGNGANGKSVALYVLEYLIGHDNCSYLSLHEMTPRNTEDLVNKIVNIGSEAERGSAMQTSLVKKVVSKEPIRAEPKYRAHYSFVTPAVLVNAVNELPAIDDRTDGIWRRMHLIKWDVTIPESERDTNLTMKLKAEMEGILNWAIEGAQRVLAEGLVVPQQIRESTKMVRLEANSTAMFCNEVIEREQNHYISKDDLYQSYGVWCKRNGYRAMSLINFAKELKRSITEVGESKSRQGYVDWRGRSVMTRVNVWTGIHIPEDRVEREVNVSGRREVLTSAIGSQAKQAEFEIGLKLVA